MMERRSRPMKDLIEVMASDQFKMDQAAQGSEIGWWIVASSIHA